MPAVVETHPAERVRWLRWHCAGKVGSRHGPAVVELPETCSAQPYCGRCGEPMGRGGFSFFTGRRAEA